MFCNRKLIFCILTTVSNGMLTFEIRQGPLRPNMAPSLSQTLSLFNSSFQEATKINVHLQSVTLLCASRHPCPPPVVLLPWGLFDLPWDPPPLPGPPDASWRLLATALLLTWLRSLQIDAILLPMAPQMEPNWVPNLPDFPKCENLDFGDPSHSLEGPRVSDLNQFAPQI